MQNTQNARTGNTGGSTQPPQDKRSEPFTSAAIVLSVTAISTICCFYSSLICGSLAIIFALLSKGGEYTMSQNSKSALAISIIAICLTFGLAAVSYITVIIRFGSIDAFLKAYLEMFNAYTTGFM